MREATRRTLAARDEISSFIGVGYELEASQFGLRFGTAEAKEGLAAFVEKRPAQFKSQ